MGNCWSYEGLYHPYITYTCIFWCFCSHSEVQRRSLTIWDGEGILGWPFERSRNFSSFRWRWRIVPIVLRPPKLLWSQRPGVQLLDIIGPFSVWRCLKSLSWSHSQYWSGLIFELGRFCRSPWTATQPDFRGHPSMPGLQIGGSSCRQTRRSAGSTVIGRTGRRQNVLMVL